MPGPERRLWVVGRDPGPAEAELGDPPPGYGVVIPLHPPDHLGASGRVRRRRAALLALAGAAAAVAAAVAVAAAADRGATRTR